MRRFVVLAVLLGLLAVSLSSLAEAKVVAHIRLSAQRMDVSVNGVPLYSWPVSTARAGYRTPTGTFKPTGLFRYHASILAQVHASLGQCVDHCGRLHPWPLTITSHAPMPSPPNTTITWGSATWGKNITLRNFAR